MILSCFKRFFLISFIVFVFTSQALGGKVYLSLVTGSPGGTYYPIGNAIAGLINKYIPEVYVIVETGNASVANCILVGNGEVEMAFAQNDVVNWAYKGSFIFTRPFNNIRTLASLYPETLHLVALKSSGIKDIYGLKGKRVAVGEMGSGTEVNVRLILEEAGLSYKDMEVSYMDSSIAAQRMKDGHIDAFFYTVGYPASVIEELASVKDIAMVPLSDDFIRRLERKFPWFSGYVIPAKTYKGQDEDVPTVSVMAMWIGSSSMPADLVYKMIREVFSHVNEIQSLHPKLGFISLDRALIGVTVPLHEGAERFYREKGLLK